VLYKRALALPARRRSWPGWLPWQAKSPIIRLVVVVRLHVLVRFVVRLIVDITAAGIVFLVVAAAVAFPTVCRARVAGR